MSDEGEDGAAAATEDFTVSVTPVNDAPTITSTAPTTATEDVEYSYQVLVSDPDDSGSELNYELTDAPAGMSISASGLITWTPSEGVTTSGEVTVEVSDGGEDGAVAATEEFTVTVTPVNDAPTITSTAPTTATEDAEYSYQVVVSDPDDSGSELSYELSNAPAGMTISASGLITWTPSEGVTTSGLVTVEVSDGGEDGATAATEDFTVSVTPVNDPPTGGVTIIGTPTEDETLTVNVAALGDDDGLPDAIDVYLPVAT